ncbi:hypothetical protein Rsub_11473 [Raphidocelis subcapitata]|uniref:RWP-RK domain-containing protein n=1 Tax=Raphidocelis subcapitata TaxID=307507 RepID=A0A2V0PH22_9CHLO|nr:hypothetical protein Rsub_11473 [Raphidocelis subcapitata]|eukprot:GBF98869.1 hypothetical protein Rsub_11473 [Raphidocelis subcapitata]
MAAAEVKARLSRAIHGLTVQLATHGGGAACSDGPDGRGGALLQVWMPSQAPDGTTVLSAQGLPFAVAGVGDLLALFRCVSCRYRFSTDESKPALMGAIGRVYSSCEPEMCNDLQKYDKEVYLRVSEAQRCRVQSTLVMPVFDGVWGPDGGAAATAGGGGDGGGGGGGGAPHAPVAVLEVVQSGREVMFPEVMGWMRACLQEVNLSTRDLESLRLELALGSSDEFQPAEDAAAAAAAGAAAAGAAAAPSQPVPVPQPAAAAPRVSADGRSPGGSAASPGGRSAGAQRLVPEGEAAAALAAAVTAATAARRQARSGDSSAPGSDGRPRAAGEPSSGAAAAAGTGTGVRVKQEASSQPGGVGSGGSGSGSAAGLGGVPTPEELRGLSADAMLALLPAGGSDPDRAQRVLAAIAAAAVTSPAALEALQRWHLRQGGEQRGGGGGRAAAAGAAGGEEDGDEDIADVDGADSASSDGGGDDAGGAGPAAPRSASADAAARVAAAAVAAAAAQPLGAGRRLTYEDLQSQFGVGLKEAAVNLGICATTLKRACRRHGITRWPRRQIAKLNRALAQAGYSGSEPGAVERTANATTGLSQAQAAAAAAASAPIAVPGAGGSGAAAAAAAPAPASASAPSGAIYLAHPGGGPLPVVVAGGAPLYAHPHAHHHAHAGVQIAFAPGSYPPAQMTAVPDGRGGYVLTSAPAPPPVMLQGGAGSAGSSLSSALAQAAAAPEPGVAPAPAASYVLVQGQNGQQQLVMLAPQQQLQQQQQQQQPGAYAAMAPGHPHAHAHHVAYLQLAPAAPQHGHQQPAAAAGMGGLDGAGFLDLMDGDDDLIMPSGGVDALIRELAGATPPPGTAPVPIPGTAPGAPGGAGGGQGDLAGVWD